MNRLWNLNVSFSQRFFSYNIYTHQSKAGSTRLHVDFELQSTSVHFPFILSVIIDFWRKNAVLFVTTKDRESDFTPIFRIVNLLNYSSDFRIEHSIKITGSIVFIARESVKTNLLVNIWANHLQSYQLNEHFTLSAIDCIIPKHSVSDSFVFLICFFFLLFCEISQFESTKEKKQLI